MTDLSIGPVQRCDSPKHGSAKILIVDDEPHVRHFLRLALNAEGFDVCEAATGAEALEKVGLYRPDLIILDLGLPDLDGREIIKDVRLTVETPILVLSGRTEDSEKVAALDHGADDYMTKPFAIRELVFRVRTALDFERIRKEQTATGDVRTGRLRICMSPPVVFRDNQPLALDAGEHALLRALAAHGGRMITVASLGRTLWGHEGDAEHDRELQELVGSLRRKIEDEPSFPVYILTEPAVGYRLAILPSPDGE